MLKQMRHSYQCTSRTSTDLSLSFSKIQPTTAGITVLGQVVPYTGEACKGFVDYNVWLPEGTTNVSTVEAVSGLSSILISPLQDPCRSTILSFICSAAFPQTVANQQQNLFSTLSKLPPAFVDDPIFRTSSGLLNGDNTNCNCGCCLPCPQSDGYYPQNRLRQGFMIMDIFKGISALLALVLIVSHFVLPEKLQRPQNLILFVAIASFVFNTAVVLSHGNPKRIQCVGPNYQPDPEGIPIVTANFTNNSFCAAQGAWVIFGSMATSVWLSMIMINWHLRVAWNSYWLGDRTWITHSLGWGLPAVLTSIAIATRSTAWNNSNM
ncbi:hypothetical protein BGZ83_007376 [Gryganskiella cystojenkinii]|nr:hypothetical protein BGZ83_007376 [Gryganskiella cystojenkinii]